MPQPILTQEQMQAIADALEKQIPELERQIALAKQAKIDVSAQEEQLTRMKSQLQAMHAVYVAPHLQRKRV